MPLPRCVSCNSVLATGIRCPSCYAYFRRTGKERTELLALKAEKKAWKENSAARKEARKLHFRWARLERFLSLISKDHFGCWTWTGTIGPTGYGTFHNPDGSNLAHRISYEIHVGPIPDDMVIDHLCREKRCVRPSHLDPVTNSVNAQRVWNRRTTCWPTPKSHS